VSYDLGWFVSSAASFNSTLSATPARRRCRPQRRRSPSALTSEQTNLHSSTGSAQLLDFISEHTPCSKSTKTTAPQTSRLPARLDHGRRPELHARLKHRGPGHRTQQRRLLDITWHAGTSTTTGYVQPHSTAPRRRQRTAAGWERASTQPSSAGAPRPGSRRSSSLHLRLGLVSTNNFDIDMSACRAAQPSSAPAFR